jgi:hypothetical protein
MSVIFSLVFLLAGFGLSTAAEQDVKGSKDPSLLSRMPHFHISGYKETEFDSHRFIDQDKKPLIIEGHKYHIEYREGEHSVAITLGIRAECRHCL